MSGSMSKLAAATPALAGVDQVKLRLPLKPRLPLRGGALPFGWQLVLTTQGVDAYLAIDKGWDGHIPADTLALRLSIAPDVLTEGKARRRRGQGGLGLAAQPALQQASVGLNPEEAALGA